jgi:multisubunit Na+/H+ antiporter MnhC subunit
MLCLKCGAQNPEDSKFCCKCGATELTHRFESGTQAALASKPYGIGGWLAFLCVSFTVISPLVWFGEAVSFFQKGHVALGLLALLMAVASFIVGLWLLLRDPSAIKLAKAYLLANIGVSVIISFAGTPGSLDDPHVLGFAVGRAIGVLVAGSIVTAIWWLYLNKSVRVKNTYGVVAATTNLGNVPSPTAQRQRPLNAGEADKKQTTSPSLAEAEVPAPLTGSPPPNPTMPGQPRVAPEANYRVLGVVTGIALLAMFVMVIIFIIGDRSEKNPAPIQDLGHLSTTPALSRDFTEKDLSALRILDTTSKRKTGQDVFAEYGGRCISGCDEPMSYQVWLTVSNKSQATLHTLKTQVTLPAYHISGESLKFNCQHNTLEGSVPDIPPNTTGDCASDTWPNLWDNKASFVITGAQAPDH